MLKSDLVLVLNNESVCFIYIYLVFFISYTDPFA